MDNLQLRGDIKFIHYKLGQWVETIETEFDFSNPDVNEYLRIADKLEDAQSHVQAALDIVKQEL